MILMTSNLNSPIDYLRHQLLVLEGADVHCGVTWDVFVRDIPKTILDAGIYLDVPVNKVYGRDFDGFVFQSEHGPIAVGVKTNADGKETMVFNANAAAEEAYRLTSYRWGHRHIHTLFGKLTDVSLPKGSYVFYGEIQCIDPVPMYARDAA